VVTLRRASVRRYLHGKQQSIFSPEKQDHGSS
jgi:hypothetical protein